MEKLFLAELREIYGAEKHQLMVLPLLKKAASSLRLQNTLANHLDATREHITRLERILSMLGKRKSLVVRQPEAILGIGREAETVIGTTQKGTATRDAGLIVVTQKLEHYEISSYGSLAQLARTLEFDDILDVLETTLYEEKEFDELLTALAENYINTEASREYSE
jgi:ferritin-like metal-binding protein YciE